MEGGEGFGMKDSVEGEGDADCYREPGEEDVADLPESVGGIVRFEKEEGGDEEM